MGVPDLTQQPEHLRLHRDVERRRRLVRDQQLRLEREPHRDHRPLLHAARILMRVLARADACVGEMHGIEQADRPLVRLRLAQPAVQLVGLTHLAAHPEHRVERAQRILRNQRDAVAPDAAHLALRLAGQRLACERDGAGGDPRALGQKAEDGERRHGLARAGFADEADDLPRPDLQARPVDDPCGAACARELDAQVVDPERRRPIVPCVRANVAAVAVSVHAEPAVAGLRRGGAIRRFRRHRRPCGRPAPRSCWLRPLR